MPKASPFIEMALNKYEKDNKEKINPNINFYRILSKFIENKEVKNEKLKD